MRKKNNATIIVLTILILSLGAIVYLYNSPMFERNAPVITVEDTIYWNQKEPIVLKIDDDSGIKFVRAILSDGENSITLHQEVYQSAQQNLELNLLFPRTGFFSKSPTMSLHVEAVDVSKWNLFSGNQSDKVVEVIIDTKKPELTILGNSYKITKGGSASVIFRAVDPNIKSIHIVTNNGDKFYPMKFYKDDYFISLVAWPRVENNFHADIVVEDLAGNISKERIRYFLQNRNYRTSTINLTDRFLEGKVSNLASEHASNYKEMTPLERFMFVNQDLRKQDVVAIEAATKVVPKGEYIENKLIPFYPLRNGAAVASFGDHRKYAYDKQVVSESYHLGLDLASVALAPINLSNDGVVVFAGEMGIYGNTIIVDHGLGIFSLYSHCTSINVQVGDFVKSGTAIATTGTTGFAFGDHLHFGVLVQGVEVRPEEWMDKDWMNDNLYSIIDRAKKIIDKK